MNAKEGYIVRLLDGSDKKFVIPVYQRAYSWKKANCELLFNDLLEVYHNNYASHFFGSIVYVDSNLGGYNEYIIIDGQQRLTTVSLLLLAIKNYVQQNHIITQKINPIKINNAFLTDESAQGEKKLKLKLVQGDDDAYDRLIEYAEPIPNNNITINYNYFYDRLSGLSSVSELEGIYEAVTKLMIVNISLKPQNGDDPQLIFESLNSTGMDLDESDKIRNYVLMRLDSAKQEKIYKNFWEKLEQKINKQDVSKFIRYYLAKKTRVLPDERKLYFAFKIYREGKEDLPIEDILVDILKYADYYQTIKTAKVTDPGYRGRLARINKLDINIATPLLFELFDAHHNELLSSEELDTAISIVENYIVRRIICGMPTSSLNKVFVLLGEEIEKHVNKEGISFLEALKYAILSKSGKIRFPSDHDLAERFAMFELYNAKSAVRKYIFERLENHKSKERVAVAEQIESGDLTIEHIMPQSLTPKWQKYLGDNYEFIHSKYLNTIGNLTLTAYNSEYSNLPFDEKRDMPDKGFASSKLLLNKFVGGCSVWNEAKIQERADILLQWALQIWPLPKTGFEPQVSEEWVTLDDEYDFTNKKIIKLSMLGDEISADNLTDAYKKVMARLYMLDPLRFAAYDGTFISINGHGLTSPYSLDRALYIETNLNSQAKIAAIRDMFKSFEIDPNELMFLVQQGLNVNDESTYGLVTIGALAYALISKLFSDDKITSDEFEKMLTKEYTKKFKSINYPIIALSRYDNRGQSKKIRYRAKPINFNGTDIYVSMEWFDEARDDLTKWFKSFYQ